MKKLYSYSLLSHQDTKLIDHLRFVGDRASDLIRTKDIKFKYSKEQLCYVAKVMGYCHDIGKATSFFKEYLNDSINKVNSNVNEKLKSHALISSIICFYNLKEIDKELAIIAYVAIKHHHGKLRDFVDEIDSNKEEIKLIKNQFSSLDNEIKEIAKELNLKLPSEYEILDLLKETIDDELDEYNDKLVNNKSFEKYILFKLFFSVLIYADKEHAIFKKDNTLTYDISENFIDKYKSKKFGIPDMSNIRNQVYNDVLNSIKDTKRIMSITLPTGTGKTYTCMASALKLKKTLKKDMKIIYCLPFTSVIDQNFEDYKNALKETMNLYDVTSDKILKHHYLSPKDYTKTDIYYEGDEARFLTQNWNSQIVVTTFIQLFNTLFSNENSSLIKYNSLSNSIILLDEVQSIPYKYWKIINKLLIDMADRLNIYFILITATQPLIFEENEIMELASKSDEYFNSCKRTKMIIHQQPINKEEFFEFSEKIILQNPNKNILFIVNTIKLSQELYNKIKAMENERELEYLSTSIIPIERRKRIDGIKKSKKRMIVVSTQMVEAGVDIDMDIVVRDIAPLDSINQSAGRANRESRGVYLGEVHIVKIKENNKYLAQYVYTDPILLNSTEKVLSGKDIILEEEYKNINNKYFKEVKNNSANRISNRLINLIYELEFEKINNEFKLIENQDKIQLFIEVDNIAKEVWNKYLDYKKIVDIKEKRTKLESIKSDFYNYVISVFKNKFKENIDGNLGYISSYELSNVYDEKFGYKSQENSQIIL